MRHPDGGAIFNNHRAVELERLHQTDGLGAGLAGARHNGNISVFERFDRSQSFIESVGVMVQQCAIQIGIDDCHAHAATPVRCIL